MEPLRARSGSYSVSKKDLILFACTDMSRAGKHRYSKKGILSVQSA